ncbi:uncharacterized protein [Montipora foliosa]|uniref:uncharacterized protein n=1 Tax=Montipora foliosa TaxID=591990 RepID=UPI0035F15421
MALRLIVGVLKRKFPNVPVITTDELQNLMKTSQARRKLVLLDTREENEYKVSHLSKAVRLNPEETDMSKVIKMIQEKAGPPETDPKTVVCYCAVGYRASIMSQRLLDELKKQQNTSMKPDLDVYSLEGAIFKWANERKELVDPNGNSTPMVHGFDRLWGILLFKDIKKLGP